MTKVNKIVRHHNRSVLPVQAQRHVAEQIDRLYWLSAAPDLHTGRDKTYDQALDREADLRDAETIKKLPETWPESQEVDGPAGDRSGLEAYADSKRHAQCIRSLAPESYKPPHRYEQLQQKLLHLSESLQAQQDKLAQYKALQNVIAPLRDPSTNIQPNLAAKDGELGIEFEKMRILIAKVIEKMEAGGAMNGREDATGWGENMGMDMDLGLTSEEKIARILEGSSALARSGE